MIEAYGDIWDNIEDYDAVVITTNGFVKTNGEAVLGRGIALEAKERFTWLPRSLGESLNQFGNIPFIYGADYDPETGHSLYLITLPVKPSVGSNGEMGWKAKADLVLIGHSLFHLNKIVDRYKIEKVLMPRPGCGNGGLKWEQVKPVIEPYLDDRFTVMERL